MALAAALPIATFAVGAISGIANYMANKSANDRAQMLQDRMFQEWMQINIPDPEKQRIVLEKFVTEGVLAPEMEHAIAQDPSAFQSIVANDRDKVAQNRALGELEGIGYKGGLRLQDKAALQEATMQSQVADRSNREGISAEMARRGLSGSGYDVAARLQGQQATGDRDARSSLGVAAHAQDRALQAIMGAGDLATKYRGQDFQEQSAKATAADRINQFNTENLRAVQSHNVGAGNRAQEMNLAAKQRTSDQNTGMRNTQNAYNQGLLQQQYENKMKQLAGASGQAQMSAATTQRGGQLEGHLYSNIGSAAGQAMSSYGAAQQADTAATQAKEEGERNQKNWEKLFDFYKNGGK